MKTIHHCCFQFYLYHNCATNQTIFEIKNFPHSYYDKDISKVFNNYAENYFLPEGEVLLKTDKNIPLVTLNKYGKGMILSMVPFAYNDTRYDGELLRWNLIEYVLDTTVLKKDEKVIEKEDVVVEEVKTEEVKTEVKVVETKKENNSELNIIDMSDTTNTVSEYCVQLYSDGNKDSFMRTLTAHKDLKNIRGEIRGRYYVIRAGRYSTLNDASNDVKYYKNYFNDAFARECIYKK